MPLPPTARSTNQGDVMVPPPPRTNISPFLHNTADIQTLHYTADVVWIKFATDKFLELNEVNSVFMLGHFGFNYTDKHVPWWLPDILYTIWEELSDMFHWYFVGAESQDNLISWQRPKETRRQDVCYIMKIPTTWILNLSLIFYYFAFGGRFRRLYCVFGINSMCWLSWTHNELHVYALPAILNLPTILNISVFWPNTLRYVHYL